MTTKQIMELKCMWDAGVPVKNMSRDTGYSENCIYTLAMHNRDLFPYRHRTTKHHEDGIKKTWARRVRHGESTINNAARQCGVTRGTIRAWVRKYA